MSSGFLVSSCFVELSQLPPHKNNLPTVMVRKAVELLHKVVVNWCGNM